MKIFWRFIVSILVLLGFGFTQINFNNQEPVNKNALKTGEELTYVVKYLFIPLGEIKLKTIRKYNKDGKVIFETRADIKSYEGLPFVDLESIYSSHVTGDYYSEFFFAIDKYSYGWTFTKYDFDYRKGFIVAQRGFRDGWVIHYHDTIKIKQPVQDGLSIFYFARGFARQEKSMEILTFFKENLTTTKINFYKDSYPVKIDAVDYEIDCVRLDGVLGYTGIFGLTGKYEGYFTNDEAAIPIKASLKVIIGNINVELKSWKRNDWKPPRKI